MESAVCPTPNIQQTLGCGGQETCEHIKDCRWVGRTKGIGICDTGFLKRTHTAAQSLRVVPSLPPVRAVCRAEYSRSDDT